MTSAGLRRIASVCGVSPLVPPGSLRFATSMQWGRCLDRYRLSRPASRLTALDTSPHEART